VLTLTRGATMHISSQQGNLDRSACRMSDLAKGLDIVKLQFREILAGFRR
jgi:hypothetical protein